MDERRLKKRMVGTTIIMISLMAFILIAAYFIIHSLKNIQKKSEQLNIESSITEYRIKVDGRIEANFELLNSLGPFLKRQELYGDQEFMESLDQSNIQNRFYRMGFFGTDGMGMVSTLEEPVRMNVHISELSPELQRVVEEAQQGIPSISDVYEDEETGENYLAFSVPVYKDGAIVGVLAASENLDLYDDLLNYSKSLEHLTENVDLINDEGDFLVYSKQSTFELTEDRNLFSLNVLPEDTVEQVKAGMAQREKFTVYFDYEGNSYYVVFEPLQYYDWYLMYTSTSDTVFDSLYQGIRHGQRYLVGILLIVFILNIYMYRTALMGRKALENLAFYDPVTGSYNLEKFKIEVDRNEEKIQSIAVINVKKFLYINKMFGMEKANILLCEMSRLIKEELIQGEVYCRENADQFLIAMADSDEDVIKSRMQHLMSRIQESAKENFNKYHVELAVGVTLYAKDGKKQLSDHIELAIFALKESKKNKGNQITFWSKITKKLSDLHFYVDSHKYEAIEKEEFRVYLQPKKDLETDEFTSAEVLVRWVLSDGTVLFPDQFIPDFEENGFCVNLDLYMFKQACRIIRKWIDNGQKVLSLSINQCKLLFYKEDYVQLLCQIADKYQVPKHLLTLEILESTAMEDLAEMNQIVMNLQKEGFRVSIDDFGSGYSSLNVLGNLHVDELKLDRIFLRKTIEEGRKRIIIRYITEIANEIGISIVIEGVENKENEDFIKTTHSSYGQGYYYSKPIPLDEFEKHFM